MQEFPSSYDPKIVEKKWRDFWDSKDFFTADPKSSKPAFSIILPPPNVTGTLHMGHALVNTLQDVQARLKRMQGYEVLWQPGTDHAGIATQTVVERKLIKEHGKRRVDYERLEFLEHVWTCKEESQDTILKQLKSLGCSCDWSRLRFTMDEKSSHAVRVMFKKMFDEGLIYRGNYLVNWDPATQTALADDEVEYEEKASSLWYIRYPVAGTKEHIVIATTRPETMLGDTAVAVSPKDERYKSLIGKKICLPLVDRIIPILSDPFVDPEFGTGAVKITPAHDPNDYEMAHRHSLSMINIMTPDGKVNEEGQEFQGLSMQEARKAVVDKLKELDLIEKIEPYTLRVGVSYRSKAIIEPYLSKQWFVKMSAFKKPLLEAVRSKRVEITPSYWEDTYAHWIENLRDWCISRQIWWGHQIPIWYHKDDPEKMICFAEEGLPSEVEKSPEDWQQDPDVLDTWFSSALWPISTLGWPEKAPELEKFYPTSLLVTGHDILFFWVARMILMGEYALGEIPFHQAFIHGLIYGKSYWRVHDGSIQYVPREEKQEFDLGKPLPKDVHAKWEKMSKSKGNVIDPREISNEYGTDAMRMALTSSTTHARQIDLDLRRFEEFKNFANKVWNGARFIFMNLFGEDPLTASQLSDGLDTDLLTLEDRWILSLLNRTIEQVTKDLEAYAFDKAATLGYEFYWKSFCAYYLELVKPTLFGKAGTVELRKNKQKILALVLCSIVRLLHPMAPFITEELFALLKSQLKGLEKTKGSDPYTQEMIDSLKASCVSISPYPVAVKKDMNEKIESQFSFLEKLVHAVRNIRAEMKLPLHLKTDLYILGDKKDLKIAEENTSFLEALLKLDKLHISPKNQQIFGSTAIVGPLKLLVPMPHELQEQEKKRLSKEHEKLLSICSSTKAKLSNKEFCEKAPQAIVEKMQDTLNESQKKLLEVEEKLNQLQ